MDDSVYDEAYFEGRSSNYWWTVGSYGNLRQFPHWGEMLKIIQEFRGSGRLLDVGCAYGLLVDEASKCFESYGIDISRFALTKSKEYCEGNVSRASAASLPFKGDSFNVITLLDTLEHIPNFDECLEDVVRVLKKGGILLLQLPNPLIWTHLCGRFGFKDETHANNFRLQKWHKILLRHGLKIEKCLGFVSYAFKKTKFFVKSERAALLFPEIWIVARK